MKNISWLFMFSFLWLTSLNAQEFKQIQNRWKPNQYLHNESRKIEAGPLGAPGWHSAHWQFIPVAGTNYVQIRNRFGNDFYLHVEENKLQVGPLGAPGWHSAHWELIPVAGTEYVQIKNRFGSNFYLHVENGRLETGALGKPGWWSAQWKIKSLNQSTANGGVDENIPENQKGYTTTNIISRIKKLRNRGPVPKEYRHSKIIPNFDPGKHTQGMAVFNDETYMVVHNLDNSMGYQILTSGKRLKFQEENIGDYQSGSQACGDFVAIATKLSKGKSEVRFYQKKSNKLQRIQHLTIPLNMNLENVGFVYHPIDKVHYIAAENYFFKTNGKNLLDPNCKFEGLEIKGATPFGEAGCSLMYENPTSSHPKGVLYWAVLHHEPGPNTVKVSKINFSNNTVNISKVLELNLNKSVKYNLSFVDFGADTRPGFRWGGSMYVNRKGEILAVACERNAHEGVLYTAEWNPNKDFKDNSAIGWIENVAKDIESWTVTAASDTYVFFDKLFNGTQRTPPQRGTTLQDIPDGVRHYVVTLFHVSCWDDGDDNEFWGDDIELYGSISAIASQGKMYSNPGANQYLFHKREGDRVVLSESDNPHYSRTERKDFYIPESEAENAKIDIVSRLMEHDDFDNDKVFTFSRRGLGKMPVGYYKEFEFFAYGENEREKVRFLYAVARLK